jgi:serine/threonine protein kinase
MPEAKSAWHAPEVLQSFRAESLSAAANVYTFGMLLWQIVSGEAYLFDGAACDADLVSEIVFDHKRPPIPEHIPTALKTLITQCWAADPQKRPHLDQVLSELAEMCELGPDKLELENGVNGARLYRKGITIRAFKSKDPITVVKDWGRSYGDAGCYICQSNAGQTEAKTNSTPEEQMLGDDVEIVDAKAFLNTYEQIPGGRPFEFRMVGNVLAKKMTHPFVVKHPRDGTFSQGLAGDYLVQKSTDDVWALEGAKFEKDFCLVEVED